MGFEHASTTDIGRRSIQQDEHCDAPLWEGKAHFYGVFDGHGTDGHKAAGYAKNNFPKILNQMPFNDFLQNPQEVLTNTFSIVNTGMNEETTLDTYMSGTTATILISLPGKVIVANVGDSRLVLGKKNGSGIALTVDHTCEIPEEVERVKESGGRIEQALIDGVHDGPKRIYKGSLPYPGLVVSRSLGDSVASKIGVICVPYVVEHKIEADDQLFILGSDGLWDGISNSEAVRLIQPYLDIDLSLASSILTDAALAGLDKIQIDDNITNILIRFNERLESLAERYYRQRLIIESIQAMLSFNGISSADGLWKVLIYDKLGQDVISPLLKVNELRESGITVHLPLDKERYSIADVPAIYFVTPNLDNLQRIASDLEKKLYDSYYINFCHSIPRHLLEEFATMTLAAKTAGAVAQVYDQYLDFVCLESNLFTLQMKDSYHTINDVHSTESVISAFTDRIVSSLFSVVITMGVIPVIRCEKGSVAEAVAVKLDSKLRDHLLNSKSNISAELSGKSLSRPLLLLVDRMMDISSMLTHTWTYSTLVHDILNMELNRVVVTTDSGRKVYDVDSTDPFWLKNAGNPFPQVAEEVDQEINKYKKEVDEVTKSCGVDSIEEVDPNDFTGGAKGLSAALNKLPQLTLRKKSLDMHMNIATNLFKIIQERHLDSFFSMEESIGKLNKSTLLEVINDSTKSAEDKIRLFVVYFLSHDEISKSDLAEYESALTAAGCEITILNYTKQVRMFNKMATTILTQETKTTPTGNAFLGNLTSLGSKVADHLQSSGVSNRFESLISSVKNLLPTRKDLPVTRILQDLLDVTSSSPEMEEYLYLDPKLSKSSLSKIDKSKMFFNDAIVFMIGGGNYLEYQNLMDCSSRFPGQKRNIVYGSTELLTAAAFLNQLERLGKGRL